MSKNHLFCHLIAVTIFISWRNVLRPVRMINQHKYHKQYFRSLAPTTRIPIYIFTQFKLQMFKFMRFIWVFIKALFKAPFVFHFRWSKIKYYLDLSIWYRLYLIGTLLKLGSLVGTPYTWVFSMSLFFAFWSGYEIR